MAITTLNNRSINRSDTAAAGQVWTATSATAADFQAAGGKIGQVVQTVNTATETLASATFTTISDFTVSITPAATSSKILVLVNALLSSDDGYSLDLQLFKDTTQIFMGDAASSRTRASFQNRNYNARSTSSVALCYLDSPSSTSELDYSCKWAAHGGATIYMNRLYDDTDAALNDARTASSITVMEILA